jgi:hypothetical protein
MALLAMVRLSPIDECHRVFREKGVDFPALLELHYRHGYVVSTPEVFVMGRPVERDALPEEIRDPAFNIWNHPDAWWFHGFWGNPHVLWRMMPFDLPYVGWEKFDMNLRFYPLADLRRFTNAEKAMATA